MTAPKLILVGCVKGKRTGTFPAKDLYVSALFSGRRRYAETQDCPWFILSAKFGLVGPGELVSTYDATLRRISARERRAWSDGVLREIGIRYPTLRGWEIEIHAGKEYYGFGLEAGLERAGARVQIPTEHLGLGQQLAWYKR